MGAPRISCASPPSADGLALELTVEKLKGQDIPKLTTLPLPLVTSETVKACKEGTWAEMKAGCNAFPPSLVPNPGWFASIYSPDARNRTSGSPGWHARGVMRRGSSGAANRLWAA